MYYSVQCFDVSSAVINDFPSYNFPPWLIRDDHITRVSEWANERETVCLIVWTLYRSKQVKELYKSPSQRERKRERWPHLCLSTREKEWNKEKGENSMRNEVETHGERIPPPPLHLLLCTNGKEFLPNFSHSVNLINVTFPFCPRFLSFFLERVAESLKEKLDFSSLPNWITQFQCYMQYIVQLLEGLRRSQKGRR